MVTKTNASYHVSLIHLLEDGLAEVESASSFLSVSGGDYQVTTDENTLIAPISERNGDFTSGGAIVSYDGEKGSSIFFHQVPYLSLKQTISTAIRKDMGMLDASLHVEGKQIVGTVQNKTAYALDSLYLDLGLQRISLGAFQPGESKKVAATVEEYFLPDQSYNQVLPEAQESREDYIKNLKWNVSYASNTKIRLVGITSQPIDIVNVQFAGQNKYWSVLAADAELDANTTGKLVYPYGTLPVYLEEQSGFVESKQPNTWDIVKGEVTFALSINRQLDQITRVEIPLDKSPFRPFKKEIFHQKSGTWKVLGRAERVILEKNMNEYVDKDGNIEIRFSNATAQRFTLPQPYFQVEGVERKR